MSKSFQAQRLDVAAFVRAGAQLQGEQPLAEYPRLAREAVTQAPQAQVHWQLQGGERAAGDGSQRPSLHVQARVVLPLACQRCLGPVQVQVTADRHVLFAPTEESAATLDELSEDDVLVLDEALDVHALVEDELLLALPLVPHHDDCAAPVQLSVHDADYEAAEQARPNPFAVLAELKSGKPGVS